MNINEYEKDFLNNAFDFLFDKFNEIYIQYIYKYNIESDTTFNILENENQKNIWVNHVGSCTILRIDVNSPIITLRTKHLFDKVTNTSNIRIIDFSINKIYLRSGGFGSKILEAIMELHKMYLKLFTNSIIPVKISVFHFMSIPFWLNNGFEFKQMEENNEGENIDQNTTYKFFKLLIIMNKHQNLNTFVQNMDSFSLSSSRINDLLKRQIYSFYNVKYNTNLWIKERIIKHVVNQFGEDFQSSNNDLSTKLIYTNICNQEINEEFQELGIRNIMWELFYLENNVFL